MVDIDLKDVIKYIPPSSLSYQEWLDVGMALKEEGYTVDVWDDWSRSDTTRYKENVCSKKWESFHGSSSPVTAGTIVNMAKANGFTLAAVARALDWEDEIGVDKKDTAWIESETIPHAFSGNQVEEIVAYLSTIFKPEEKVGYVVASFKDDADGKYKPKGRGDYTRTAGEILESIEKLKKKGKDENDIVSEVFGDYDRGAGAWIRFNPLDGNGVKNENVTSYKYALVESDSIDIEKQYGIIKEIQMPVAILVHSGGKSLHAIVKIDAPNYQIYKERVERLYKVCDEYGLNIDRQNKNPSRLSRFPGFQRGSKKQFIVATNIGVATWKDFEAHISDVEDDLPDPINLISAQFDSMDLQPEVIEGILRKGRKMIVTGPSKAGKSFLLVELAISLASGGNWIGLQCRKSKVLYVNFEIPQDSFHDRVKNVLDAKNVRQEDVDDRFQTLDLRGRANEFRKLLPGLQNKIRKYGYEVVIIDPIYKTLLGDENDAKTVSEFCNTLDKLAATTGVTIIFCHHHSKSAGGTMVAQNRASGSGVFARDPDAIFDILEIEPKDSDGTPLEITDVEDIYLEDLKGDDKAIFLRVETSLREFPFMEPFEIAFKYPRHYVVSGLESARDSGSFRTRKEKQAAGRATQTKKKDKNIELLISKVQFESEPLTVSEWAKELGKAVNTIKNWVEESGCLYIRNGLILVKKENVNP